MAKLQYGAITSPAYAHNLSEIRTWFQRISSFLKKSPGAAADINATLQVLAADTGFVQAQPSTKAIVTNGDTKTITDAAARSATGTIAVAANAVTGITIPGTSAIINSTVKFTAPAITGSYVNGYTLTIANGVVTGIVAS